MVARAIGGWEAAPDRRKPRCGSGLVSVIGTTWSLGQPYCTAHSIRRLRSMASGWRARPRDASNSKALEWCVCWMHTTTMTAKRDKSHDPSAEALGRWETEGGASKDGRNSIRPRDSNQLAKLIVDMATGEALRETKLEDGTTPRRSRWADSAG